MKSPSLSAALWFLFLTGCNLSMTSPTAQAPVLNPYGVWNADKTEYRWYNGNGQLLSIDDYVRDKNGSPGNPVEQSHYNASDVLQWYELNQFQSFGGQWEMTQKRHFLPPAPPGGVLATGQSWAYDSQGDQVLTASYSYNDAVTGWQYSWVDTSTKPSRSLQNSTYSSTGTPGGYDVYDYTGCPSPTFWMNHVTLDGTLNYQAAESKTLDSQNRMTADCTYGGTPPTWAKVAASFASTSASPYLKAWSTAPGTPGPAVPAYLVAPVAAAAVSPADTGTSISRSPFDTLAELPLPSLTTYPVKLVGFPSLNVPSTWTTSATEYYYTLSTGASVVVHFNASDLPTTVTYTDPKYSTIQVGLTYDGFGNLTQRTITYGTNQVLTESILRDGAERITEADLSGSLLTIPLTYLLTYQGSSLRPTSLEILSAGTALLTLDLTYASGTLGTPPFGLGDLSLDSLVQTLTVSLGGGTSRTPALEFVFAATGSGSSASVYDILGKTDSTKVLRGQLSWTQDSNQLKNSLSWNPVSGSSWSYTFAWGTYAQMPSGVADQTLQGNLDSALSAIDGFDLEKIFQPVASLLSSHNALLTPMGQQSANLIDLVKSAVSH